MSLPLSKLKYVFDPMNTGSSKHFELHVICSEFLIFTFGMHCGFPGSFADGTGLLWGDLLSGADDSAVETAGVIGMQWRGQDAFLVRAPSPRSDMGRGLYATSSKGSTVSADGGPLGRVDTASF